MYAPYPENMMESIKKVEATRAERMATEPRRLTADEKDALLKDFIRIITRTHLQKSKWVRTKERRRRLSWLIFFTPQAVS